MAFGVGSDCYVTTTNDDYSDTKTRTMDFVVVVVVVEVVAIVVVLPMMESTYSNDCDRTDGYPSYDDGYHLQRCWYLWFDYS